MQDVAAYLYWGIDIGREDCDGGTAAGVLVREVFLKLDIPLEDSDPEPDYYDPADAEEKHLKPRGITIDKHGYHDEGTWFLAARGTLLRTTKGAIRFEEMPAPTIRAAAWLREWAEKLNTDPPAWHLAHYWS